MNKRLAILGSTGSIGTQCLEVVDQHPEHFTVEILTAHSNVSLLAEQAKKYQPNAVVITDPEKYEALKALLDGLDIKVFEGSDALLDVVTWSTVDMVITAIVGVAGLPATFAALRARKHIGLANKETLVVAGDLVMKEARASNVPIIPIDSEHSAIFQCLLGENPADIEKVILTASGGPFRGKKTNFLVNVKKSHAMQHPNWVMGAKISIDSATLMNKGLEMIEAKHLFGLQNNQIEVVVHPESIVHSMVQMVDGSVKAQLGLPDMKLPIQYALAYPKRLANDNPRLDLIKLGSLSFEHPDVRTFKNLELATNAMHQGGNAPAILNAANEAVVAAFLNNKIGFLEMSDIIEQCLADISHEAHSDLDQLLATSAEATKLANKLIALSEMNS